MHFSNGTSECSEKNVGIFNTHMQLLQYEFGYFDIRIQDEKG